eukprot:3179721-Alexandrium_andersonii.AAC.1
MHVPPHMIDSTIHMWGQPALSRTTQPTPLSSCIAMPEWAKGCISRPCMLASRSLAALYCIGLPSSGQPMNAPNHAPAV